MENNERNELIKQKYDIINQTYITRNDFAVLTGLTKYIACQEFNKVLVQVKKYLDEQNLFLPSKNKYLPTDLVLKFYPAISRKNIERAFLQLKKGE